MSPRVVRARSLLAGLALGLAPALVGCPRDLETPDRGEGEQCVELPDCNAGRACGLLRACVDARCEASPTVLVPCPDAAPLVLPDAGL